MKEQIVRVSLELKNDGSLDNIFENRDPDSALFFVNGFFEDLKTRSSLPLEITKVELGEKTANKDRKVIRWDPVLHVR